MRKVKRFLFFCVMVITYSSVTVSDTDRVSAVLCTGKWEWESEKKYLDERVAQKNEEIIRWDKV